MNEIEKSIYESQKQTIKVAGHDIDIDAANLSFNEATLNEYIQTEGAKYNYYGAALADALAQWQLSKLQYDVVYAEKFKQYKPGATEKLAEACAKADEEVIKASKKIIAMQRIVEILKSHLKAWDKNHDNAQSLGHMMRKEMDKLGFDIKYSQEEKVKEFFVNSEA